MKMTEMEKYFLEDETEDEYLERVRDDYSAVVPDGSEWCPITEEWIYYGLGEEGTGVRFDGDDWFAEDCETGHWYNWTKEQEALEHGFDFTPDTDGMMYDVESHGWYSPTWCCDDEDEGF